MLGLLGSWKALEIMKLKTTKQNENEALLKTDLENLFDVAHGDASQGLLPSPA